MEEMDQGKTLQYLQEMNRGAAMGYQMKKIFNRDGTGEEGISAARLLDDFVCSLSCHQS
jgi:hypothetical protein